MSKQDDPFAFDTPTPKAKREYSRDEIKEMERGEFAKFLCKEGDKDFESYLAYLRSCFSAVVRAQLLGNEPKPFASPRVLAFLKDLVKDMPERPQVPLYEVEEGDDEETIAGKQNRYKIALKRSKDDHKQAVAAFVKASEPKLRWMAKTAVVGTLGRHGEAAYLKSKRVAGWYPNGQMYVVRNMEAAYDKCKEKIKAVKSLQGKRAYAQQMELLASSQQSLADNMKIK